MCSIWFCCKISMDTDNYVNVPTSVQPPAGSYHIIVGQLWIYLAEY